jgi:hypothetical protein
MQGKNILGWVVILYETIHELHQKNYMGLYLKLILKRYMTRSNVLFFNKLLDERFLARVVCFDP